MYVRETQPASHAGAVREARTAEIERKHLRGGVMAGRQERFVAGPSASDQHRLDRASGRPIRILSVRGPRPDRRRGPPEEAKSSAGTGSPRTAPAPPATSNPGQRRESGDRGRSGTPRTGRAGNGGGGPPREGSTVPAGRRPVDPHRERRSRGDRDTRAADRRRATLDRSELPPRARGRAARRGRREAIPLRGSRTTRTRCGSTARRGRRRADLPVRRPGRRLRPSPAAAHSRKRSARAATNTRSSSGSRLTTPRR